MSRILLASSFVIIVLALLRLGVNWVLIEDQVMEEILSESIAVTQQAHIVLKQSAQIHAKHLGKLGEKEQLISQNISSIKSLSPSVIPIHFAQEVAQQGLKSEYYNLRVIRENTSNEAVLTDLDVLNQMRENEPNELFQVDAKQNVVRYISPIRVGQECLVCHGANESLEQDPSLKNELRGWKVGEIPGAFAVIVDLQLISDLFQETIPRLLLVSLIVLCFGLAIAFMVTHSILRRLKSFVIRLHQMAHNKVIIAEQVRQNSNSVALSNENQAAQLLKVMEKTKELGTHALENQDKAQLNINSTDQLNDSFQQIIAQSQSTEQAVSGMRNSIKEGSESMVNIMSVLLDVRDSGLLINKILESLNSITQQTKMLATNAAIEAARAGEHGKGFGVVANEVAKLAENSKLATHQISKLISDSAQQGMQIGELADRGNQSLKQLENKFEALSDFVEDLAKSVLLNSDNVTDINGRASKVSELSLSQSKETEGLLCLLQQMDENEHQNKNFTDKTLIEAHQLHEGNLHLLGLIKEIEGLISGDENSTQISKNRLNNQSKLERLQLPSNTKNLGG
ncbi:MAG: methyl-accepting chemotaxis protein [SAR324 cluster bacterium]|nr:methyl-accepting chemotaxis protein [SAR324 cluster bacterium]